MKKLEEYLPVFQKLSQLLIKSYDFETESVLRNAFQANQKVMTILNHSTPLSWLPAVCVLVEKACRNGGGARVPLGVMDRYFFQNPLLRPLAGYVTQFNHALSFDEVLRNLNSDSCTDVAIFPEGSNCFFGESHRIQPFRSPRFIELSLRTNTPILLAVHRGSEEWAKPIPLKLSQTPLAAYLPGWLNEKIERGGGFVLPVLPKPIRHFRMKCEFYQPSLKLTDLSDQRRLRIKQLWNEAEQVHRHMQRMFDSLAV